VKRLARKSVLSDKASQGNIIIVEDVTFDSPRTKDFVNILSKLEANGQKTLFVTGDQDNILCLSSRNLPKAKVARAQDINTYDILNAQKVVFAEGAIEKIRETFAN